VEVNENKKIVLYSISRLDGLNVLIKRKRNIGKRKSTMFNAVPFIYVLKDRNWIQYLISRGLIKFV
jgi:hypothetical protein